MAPPWDVWGVGCAMGGAAGLLLGYQTRKLIERFRDHRLIKRHIKVGIDTETAELSPYPTKRSRRAPPPVIPFVHVPRGYEQPIPVTNPDRDLVIAALMSAGYKKGDAVKATDACSMVERAHGLEAWTVAALHNARGAK